MYNREFLYGIGYVPFLMPSEMDIGEAAEYIGDLGAVNVRLWHPFREILDAPDRLNPANTEKMHKIIDALRRNGVKQIISMNHDRILPNDDGTTFWSACRMTHRGTPKYDAVMDWFEECWRTVAREFPEVDGWETGNEANHVEFMYAAEGEEFGFLEKADICTDMMFRSARAIRSVSEGKIIVMPGMAPVGGDRYSGMAQTLDHIYKNIESGRFGSANPRDFFDKLCWHPYYGRPDGEWVQMNKNVYAAAEAHGDGDVGCIFSEFGFNDSNVEENDKIQASYITEGIRLTREELPFVESVQVFRMFGFMGSMGGWDDFSLCDCRTLPPRKKEKFRRLKELYNAL